MLWIGGCLCKEVIVIWQPFQLERETTAGARAWVVEHLSTSHRNDSYDPTGSYYFTSPVSEHLAVGGYDDSGFMSTGTDIYSLFLCYYFCKQWVRMSSFYRVKCSLWIALQWERIERWSTTQGHMAFVHCCRTQRCLRKRPTNMLSL